MSTKPIPIAPSRSVAFLAVLAMLMVVTSYLVMIGLAAACVYFPYLALSSLHTSNGQLVLLFLGGLAMAGAMLWSLVPRGEKFEAPGLLLARSGHPALFQFLDEVSAALGEPLPGEVYLIGEVNAFVADRGGFLGFGSRRILAVGFPLMSILTVSEFRAILAHEFAHYYSGDTRMGPLVHRAQTAMIRTFRNIGKVGELGRVAIIHVMYLAVTFILKNTFLFFLRVIHFVSRKKEFRADELASLVAGAEPLLKGLRRIHAGGLAWPSYWSTEIVPLLNDGHIPPIGDGFRRFLAAPNIAEQVERALAKELAERKTEPYDTHPPLADRLAAVRKLALPPGESDDRPAWPLLDDPEAAELGLLEALNPRLAKARLKPVPWDGVGQLLTIPSWRVALAEHGPLLAGLTVESLPELFRDFSRFADRLPNPKGMLLSSEQRRARTRHLLGGALGLALAERGWTLEAQPGVFQFRRGQEIFDPYRWLDSLGRCELSSEAWSEKCSEWGIAHAPLLGPAG
jgi:heat shock protein HtpX